MSASAVRANTKTTKGVMDRRCKFAHGSVLGRAAIAKAEVVHVQNSAYFDLARFPRLPVRLGGDAHALRWTNVGPAPTRPTNAGSPKVTHVMSQKARRVARKRRAFGWSGGTHANATAARYARWATMGGTPVMRQG